MTKYMHSLAHMATLAEAPVSTVQRIVAEIGAQPALVLNVTPYFGSEVCGTIIARVRGWADQPAYHRAYHPEVRADAE